MNRIVTQRMAETVGRALALIPPRILERLQGVPPVFEGDVAFSDVHSGDPRSAWCIGLGQRCQVTLPWIADPPVYRWTFPDPGTVLHELGHALDWMVWRRHVRDRTSVFWSLGDHEVVVKTDHTGAMPAIATFTDLRPHARGNYSEQFAEAFRIWLSPPEILEFDWEPEQFYVHRLYRPGSRGHDGVRADNRALLELLNRLAGWPADRPPRALRAA